MKRLVCLTIGSALAACGSASKSSVTFYVDPPPDTDFACIGVAGFQATVTSGTKSAPSGPVLNGAPVLLNAECRLNRPFTVDEIDPDISATVTVEGYDGANNLRVRGSARIDNLHGGPAHVQLASTAAPPLAPILVVHRTPFLGTTPPTPLSDVTSVTVISMRMSQVLASVVPNPYFSVEPGAYAIPAHLAANGSDDGLVLFIDMATATVALPRGRATARWKGTYYAAE
jgi:hypothetical protein